MAQADSSALKLFRLPGGMQVWNSKQSGDTHVLYRELFERRAYEKHGIALRDDSVVFDVGANIGMFSLSLMDRFRGLRLFCFEPVPTTFACLERNLALSSRRELNEVHPLQLGLAAADGQATIEFFPGAPGNSTLHSEDKRRHFSQILGGNGVKWSDLWRNHKLRALLLAPVFPFRQLLLGPLYRKMLAQGVSFPCQLRTLSGVIREHGVARIDLLKIDVEGAEFEVLAGLDEEHWPLIRQLCMEIDTANKPKLPGLFGQLERLGFRQVVTENMFGGACDPNDSVPCIVFATRQPATNH